MQRYVRLGDQRVATLQGSPPRELREPAAEAVLALSRFAWIRRNGEHVYAETSLAPCAVVLHDPLVQALVAAFAVPATVEEAIARTPSLPERTSHEVIGLLLAAGVLVDEQGAAEEDEPPLAVWEFHDLLFHSRSRSGRNRAPVGGTYRFAQRFPIAPAIPPPRETATIDLERPDWERIEREDPPLGRVQSERTSIRRYGGEPLARRELAEFLYRVARVEDVWEAPALAPRGIPGGGTRELYLAKPYPSGGSLYELELYVVANACRDLDRGLYHYAGDRHVLEAVAGPGPAIDKLVSDAAAGMAADPQTMQVLIVLVARMPRIAWKYESIAYSLVLKHVGVLLHSMYLAATAMRLGGCAVGTGDSDLFARASGIDYYRESAVGEFALGSRPVAPDR